jgi:two-component system, NarL family, nitrate/nitrite response regulator NarL
VTMTIDCPATRDHRRVLLVEDHRLVGGMLRDALEVNGFDAVLSTCATAADILEEARAHRPHLVVLDLELGSAGHGLDLIRPLVGLGTTVLVLSGVTDRLELARCLEAGAVGVTSKAEPLASVLDKIQRAGGNEPVTPANDRACYLIELHEHRLAEKVRMAPFEALSRRERDVLALMMEGLPAVDIARRSFVSVATVRTQIRSILQKLDVNSQGAAAALARSAGWNPAPATVGASR